MIHLLGVLHLHEILKFCIFFLWEIFFIWSLGIQSPNVRCWLGSIIISKTQGIRVPLPFSGSVSQDPQGWFFLADPKSPKSQSQTFWKPIGGWFRWLGISPIGWSPASNRTAIFPWTHGRKEWLLYSLCSKQFELASYLNLVDSLISALKQTLQTHQILRLPRTMTPQNLTEICGKQLKRHFHRAADPRMIREWSENEPVSPQPAAQTRLLFALRTSILYWKIQRFALRLSFQISPSTAPATKNDTWASPSTAPGTITWLYYDSTTPFTWLYYDLTTPITFRYLWLDDTYYLTTPISWRHLLLDDTYYLTAPITWWHLLIDDTHYLTTPITWRYLLLDATYYLTTPMICRHLLLDCTMTWRHLLLDDTFDDTY